MDNSYVPSVRKVRQRSENCFSSRDSLRSIDVSGVTNYPIGVVQNSQGDVLIADNHNNFNLTIFTQGRIAAPRSLIRLILSISRRQVPLPKHTSMPFSSRGTKVLKRSHCKDNQSRFILHVLLLRDIIHTRRNDLRCFRLDGQLISALESKVKHAQCFDVALMDDGSVVLASKDYRIYVYRYLMSSMGTGGSNPTPPSPISSSSTTPNSNPMMGGEGASPPSINGHAESPLTIATPMASNGY